MATSAAQWGGSGLADFCGGARSAVHSAEQTAASWWRHSQDEQAADTAHSSASSVGCAARTRISLQNQALRNFRLESMSIVRRFCHELDAAAAKVSSARPYGLDTAPALRQSLYYEKPEGTTVAAKESAGQAAEATAQHLAALASSVRVRGPTQVSVPAPGSERAAVSLTASVGSEPQCRHASSVRRSICFDMGQYEQNGNGDPRIHQIHDLTGSFAQTCATVQPAVAHSDMHLNTDCTSILHSVPMPSSAAPPAATVTSVATEVDTDVAADEAAGTSTPRGGVWDVRSMHEDIHGVCRRTYRDSMSDVRAAAAYPSPGVSNLVDMNAEALFAAHLGSADWQEPAQDCGRVLNVSNTCNVSQHSSSSASLGGSRIQHGRFPVEASVGGLGQVTGVPSESKNSKGTHTVYPPADAVHNATAELHGLPGGSDTAGMDAVIGCSAKLEQSWHISNLAGAAMQSSWPLFSTDFDCAWGAKAANASSGTVDLALFEAWPPPEEAAFEFWPPPPSPSAALCSDIRVSSTGSGKRGHGEPDSESSWTQIGDENTRLSCRARRNGGTDSCTAVARSGSVDRDNDFTSNACSPHRDDSHICARLSSSAVADPGLCAIQSAKKSEFVDSTVDEVTRHLLHARDKIEAVEHEFAQIMGELIAYGQGLPSPQQSAMVV